MRTGNFQSTLHAKLNTWEKSSTLKGKWSVNAVNLICNLLTGLLTKMIFEGQRTLLKARAFEQCVATYMGVSFCETVPLIPLEQVHEWM